MSIFCELLHIILINVIVDISDLKIIAPRLGCTSYFGPNSYKKCD